ncbi:MAG: ribbon-helix-helix protein, CopG family [Thermoanaerobaculia bacterium]
MKTVVSLPDPVVEAADQLAKRLGMSRSELYARAIEGYLRSHRNEGVTEALNRVYQEEPSGLDPVISAIQAASLPRDVEWQGGKPKGLRGVVVRGEPVPETIIRDRR